MLADRAPLIAMPDQALFIMSSQTDAVREGLRMAMASAPLTLISDDDRGTAEIVLAEVLNNVVEHAYATLEGEVRLSLALSKGRLNCVIEDDGLAMPGGTPPAGNLPDAWALPEGGFGWHLIRVLSSDLSYLRIDQTNRLSFALPAERSGG